MYDWDWSRIVFFLVLWARHVNGWKRDIGVGAGADAGTGRWGVLFLVWIQCSWIDECFHF
jgi:hypothetical protein